MQARAWLLLGLSLTSACGGHSLGSPDGASPADGAPPADGAASDATIWDGGAADVNGPDEGAACPPALASASELASTPRADVNLELLALKLSPGKVVADEATYQRVLRDVGAIRAMEPKVTKISYFPHHDGRTVTLTVPSDTANQMQAGTYHAWDCLNSTYGAVMPVELLRFGATNEAFAFIELEGTYAVDLLAAEYARLPGVTSAEGNGVGGDGPTICVTSGSSVWDYVFDAASGDCPAGCIDHSFRHFRTELDGTILVLNTWSTDDVRPRPSWVTQFASPDACH